MWRPHSAAQRSRARRGSVRPGLCERYRVARERDDHRQRGGVRLGARCVAVRVSGRPAASVQLSRIVARWLAVQRRPAMPERALPGDGVLQSGRTHRPDHLRDLRAFGQRRPGLRQWQFLGWLRERCRMPHRCRHGDGGRTDVHVRGDYARRCRSDVRRPLGPLQDGPLLRRPDGNLLDARGRRRSMRRRCQTTREIRADVWRPWPAWAHLEPVRAAASAHHARTIRTALPGSVARRRNIVLRRARVVSARRRVPVRPSPGPRKGRSATVAGRAAS